MKLGKLLLILPVCLFMYGQSMAQPAGQATFVNGAVVATSANSQSRDLKQGEDIFSRDSIKTGDDARAQLQFTDGGSVSLMANTQFSVEEYLFDADGDGSVVFNLLSGGLRTVTGAIGKTKHADYELKTPVGTLGIRGTEYTAIMRSLDLLLVHVGRGKVVLSNDWGEIEVPEGQSASMGNGLKPALLDDQNDPDLLKELKDADGLPIATPELDPDFMLDQQADEYFGQPEPELELPDPNEENGNNDNHNEVCIEFPEECTNLGG